MIIKTPITLMIVDMIPLRLSHDGTLSMRIHPIRIFTAVLIKRDIVSILQIIFY